MQIKKVNSVGSCGQLLIFTVNMQYVASYIYSMRYYDIKVNQ